MREMIRELILMTIILANRTLANTQYNKFNLQEKRQFSGSVAVEKIFGELMC